VGRLYPETDGLGCVQDWMNASTVVSCGSNEDPSGVVDFTCRTFALLNLTHVYSSSS
jgi:hypothetical protein